MKRTAITRHTRRHGSIPAAVLIATNTASYNLAAGWDNLRPVPAAMQATAELFIPGMRPTLGGSK